MKQMSTHIFHTISRLGLSLLLLSGWLWSPVAQAMPPGEALRYFPKKPMMVFHINDLHHSIQEVMGLIARLGFTKEANVGITQMWRNFHRELQTQSMPKSWAEFFEQLGLVRAPSISVAVLAAPYSKLGIDVIAVAPISSPKHVLHTFRNIAESELKRKLNRCFSLCRVHLASIRLKGTGAGPVSTKLLQKEAPDFGKRCPQLLQYFKKAGQVDCIANPKARAQFIQDATNKPQQSRLHKASIYQYQGIPVQLALTRRHVVLSIKRQTLIRALARAARQKTHPLLATFQRRAKPQTHLQGYLSYRGLQLLNQLQRRQRSQQRLYRKLPFIRSIEQVTQKMSEGYKELWFELYSEKWSYHISTWVTTQKKVSPLVQKTLQIAPTHYPVLDLIPKRAWFVTSMNMLGLYTTLTSQILNKLTGGAAMIRMLAAPWLSLLGENVSLALLSSPTSPLQAIAVIGLRKPQQFDAQLKQLQQSLNPKQPPFKTIKFQGQKIRYIFLRKPGRGGPIPNSVEIAFAVLGKRLLLTAQAIPSPNLHLIKQLLNGKARGPSIRKDPVFRQAFGKGHKSNVLFYLSFTKLLNLIRGIAPPLKKVQTMLNKLYLLQYLSSYAKIDQKKRAMTGAATLQLSK